MDFRAGTGQRTVENACTKLYAEVPGLYRETDN